MKSEFQILWKQSQSDDHAFKENVMKQFLELNQALVDIQEQNNAFHIQMGQLTNDTEYLRLIAESQLTIMSNVHKTLNSFPKCFVILPEPKQDSKGLWGTQGVSWFEKAKEIAVERVTKPFITYFRLYFVCDVTKQIAFQGGPDGNGYRISVPSWLLKALTPFLQITVFALKVLLLTQGLGAVGNIIPDIPDLKDVSDKINKLLKMEIVGDAAKDVKGKVKEKIAKAEENNEKLGEMVENYDITQTGEIDEVYQLIQQSEKSDAISLSGWKPKYTGLDCVTPPEGGSNGY
jgi:hypothetical protein